MCCPAASAASQRRFDIAGGQGRGSRRPVGEARYKPAKLGSGLDGRVGGGPGRSRFTLVGQQRSPASRGYPP